MAPTLRIVKGKVKVRLAKNRVVSLAPASLIRHIAASKIKVAARKAIRHQSNILKKTKKRKRHRKTTRHGKKHRGRKRNRKTKRGRKKRKVRKGRKTNTHHLSY